MGLKVLDMAKESNSELEHTAMVVEHNIRVKKKCSEKPQVTILTYFQQESQKAESRGKIFEETMVKCFLTLMKTTKSDI